MSFAMKSDVAKETVDTFDAVLRGGRRRQGSAERRQSEVSTSHGGIDHGEQGLEPRHVDYVETNGEELE
jgi:hypothetical protein